MKILLNVVAALTMLAVFTLIFAVLWLFTTVDALSVLGISGMFALILGIPLFMWVDEKSRKRKRRC